MVNLTKVRKEFLETVPSSDKQSITVMGLERPAGVTFSLADELFIVAMENRIRNRPFPAHVASDIGTPEERFRLQELGIEVNLEYTMIKPEGLLADRILFEGTSSDRLLPDNLSKNLTAMLRNAKRISLTENSAVRVGEAIRQYPEMLVDHGVFARTPFPTCWIEFPARSFHEAVVPGSDSESADTRVGYLFHNDTVYVAAESREGGASWCPLSIHLHRGMSLVEEMALAEQMGISRGMLTQLYWGGVIGQSLDFRVARQFRRQHSVKLNLNPSLTGLNFGVDWLASTAGEVRNVIGLLLMLNQPSINRYDDVGHRRKMTKKGPRVFMSHSVLTINLDGRSKPSRLLRKPVGTHASPRWHEVIDHWCNDVVARTKGYNEDDLKGNLSEHAHEWVQDDSGELRFTCRVCGGRRWRRQMTNGRGDRSRGTISQERHVTTHGDNIKARMIS